MDKFCRSEIGTGPTFLYMMKGRHAFKTLGIALVKVRRYGRASVFQGLQAVWSDLNIVGLWERKEWQEMSLERQVWSDVKELKNMLSE